MENKIYKTKETIAEKLDLPRDVILNLPKITIIGDNEICIENHRGVILFQEKEIKVNSNIGFVTIEGSNFEILFMGGSTLTVSGKFRTVRYDGNA